LLLYQKQIVSGQNPEQHPALFAPPMQVTMAQSNAQQGPISAAMQLSRLGHSPRQKHSSPSAAQASKYNPQARGRIHDAQNRDPTAYNLHRQAVAGEDVKCLCGVTIKNNKRARAYHRNTNKQHAQWLCRQNAPASDVRATVDEVVARSADVTDAQVGDVVPHAPASDPEESDSSRKQPRNLHNISDSMLDEIYCLAPHDERLTPADNALRVGMAATSVALDRRSKAKKRWVGTPVNASWTSLSDAWRSVISKPSDFLPNHTEPHLCHLKINQFCEDCTESQLCATHDSMKRLTELDLTERHFAAMKQSGHCMVECGGSGDCFYHSMLFLAKLFRPDLFHAWGSHSKLRADTCEKLNVRLQSMVAKFFEYTQIVHRHLTAYRNCAWVQTTKRFHFWKL
jgi:hypothetical protein